MQSQTSFYCDRLFNKALENHPRRSSKTCHSGLETGISIETLNQVQGDILEYE